MANVNYMLELFLQKKKQLEAVSYIFHFFPSLKKGFNGAAVEYRFSDALSDLLSDRSPKRLNAKS